MTNKEIVLNFYRDVWNAHDTAKVADYVAEDYIQHNPNVEQGRQGLLNFLENHFFKLEAKHDIQLALEDGYIAAGETTETSVPGVYAVGDVRTKLLRQVVTAVSDGAMAAHMAEEYLAAH